MAKPTERALKRKPKAVILLTTLRKDLPSVPNEGREFEWFESDDGMHTFFDQNVEFHKEDTKAHDDMAFIAVEITDTSTDPMTLGRIDVQPDDNDKAVEWSKEVEADITKAFSTVTARTSKTDDGTKKVVKPRKRTAAATVVKKGASEGEETPAAKAAALKKRLAEKQAEDKKSETGDPAPKAAPKPRAPRKTAAAKKAASPAKAATNA